MNFFSAIYHVLQAFLYSFFNYLKFLEKSREVQINFLISREVCFTEKSQPLFVTNQNIDVLLKIWSGDIFDRWYDIRNVLAEIRYGSAIVNTLISTKRVWRTTVVLNLSAVYFK